MKKAIAISAVAATTLAVSATSFAGSGSPGPVAQKSAPVKVSMKDNFYKPGVVTVAVGGKVKWTNRGAVEHSATRIGGGFDTGLLNPGASKKVAFTKAGTFKYVCSIHPKMKGTVKAVKG